MKGLVVKSGQVVYKALPQPVLHDDHVLLKVRLAGVCRTDLMVAQGYLHGISGQPFGHEFCGQVASKGKDVSSLEVGQRVAVNPVLACTVCNDCRSGNPHLCGRAGLLGVNAPGAFADYICVHSASCYPVSDSLPDTLAAYCEPVAAMLSVLDVEGITASRVGVLGEDRIARLCRYILSSAGATLEPVDLDDEDFASQLDVLVVTAGAQTFPLAKVKAGGKIIIKSRLPSAYPLNFQELVQRRLSLIGVNYAPFSAALDFIETHQQSLMDFVGDIYALDEFTQAFAADNERKTFLRPCAD